MISRSIIVLEANEVPLKIFDYFCRRRPESTLARVMDRSSQYRTHAADKARFIMPWTTWPSFHRGVNDEMHQIFNFGQWEVETDQRYPPIWSQLVRSGMRVGVFSSMQSAPLPKNGSEYSFYFPDMFSTDSATVPADLQPLQEFNLAMTRENARNVSQRINMKSGLRVLRNSVSLGIRSRTYFDIGKQLAMELVNSSRKTRRRACQPLLMLDVFMKQLRSTRPQFSTFFTNHVAAAMHRYWAAAFPDDYEDFNLDSGWVQKYGDEIDFAMIKLDEIVSRLSDFVDSNPDYLLVIATSMGQAAIPATHVKEFLTITNLEVFMKYLGIEKADFEERPAMVPDFSFSLKTSKKADDVEAALHTLRIHGKPTDFHRDGQFFHISVYDERSGIQEATLHGRQVPIARLGMGYIIHEDEVSCTAQHVPEGTLIIYSPHSASAPSQKRLDISALDFAPATLQHFGVNVPAYMQSPQLVVDR